MANEVQALAIDSNLERWVVAYPLGIGGDTSTGLRARLLAEVSLRLDADESGFIFVITIGINDVHSDNLAGSLADTLTRYRENLGAIVSAIGQVGGVTLFVELTPVDEGFVDPLTGDLRGDAYRNDRITAMNQVLADFCAA